MTYRFYSLPKEVASIEFVMRKNKVPCPYVILSGEEEGKKPSKLSIAVDQLAGWVLIQKDLTFAQEALSLTLSVIEKDNDQSDYTSANFSFFTGLIAYAKSFSEGKGRKVRLFKEKVFADCDHSIISAHDEMKRIRNKYIAHSDKTEFERVLVMVALDPNTDEKGIVRLYHAVFSSFATNPAELHTFLSVTQFVLDYVKKKIEEAYDVLRPLVDSLSLDHLYMEAIKVDDIPPEAFSNSIKVE